jgi:hypothetical protein
VRVVLRAQAAFRAVATPAVLRQFAIAIR